MKTQADWQEHFSRETGVSFLEYFAELGSTNDRAMELLQQHPPPLPAVIVAERQTAGRGRGANRWFSEEGGLTFSLLLETGTPSLPCDATRSESPSSLSLWAGLTLAEVLQQQWPTLPVELKWPNDLLLQGRKVCGILVEMVSQKQQVAVIGVGLNVNNSFDTAPEEVRRTATSLRRELGCQLSLQKVLIEVVRPLASLTKRLQEPAGKLPVLWSRYCCLTGHAVECRTGRQRRQGICRGIREDGALLLETTAGMQTVHAAERVRLLGKTFRL